MKSFRDHVEDYKDLVFDLEQPLIIPTNNNYQNRGNCKFVVDWKSLDWYNARLSMDLKLTKLTGRNIIINDKNGIVNGAISFVKGPKFYNSLNTNINASSPFSFKRALKAFICNNY